jgi:hypothetical protein
MARKVLGWPRKCKLAHAFLWEYSYKRLERAPLLERRAAVGSEGGARAMFGLQKRGADGCLLF